MVCKRLRQGNRLGGSDYTEHHGFAPGSKRARRGRGNLMPPLSNWCDGEGATMLRQKPDDPLPLRQLIFLNRHDDIRAWFLANKGPDPLDLMVLESRREDG